MESKNGSTMPKFYAVGNAHIDLAWLWPMHETYRKTARTFAAQLRLLEEYPDYKFIQSQPAAYEMCREHYPELFERIVKAAKEGRWIAEGAMWVEPWSLRECDFTPWKMRGVKFFYCAAADGPGAGRGLPAASPSGPRRADAATCAHSAFLGAQ